MGTHSIFLPGESPWTEEPGLQSPELDMTERLSTAQSSNQAQQSTTSFPMLVFLSAALIWPPPHGPSSSKQRTYRSPTQSFPTSCALFSHYLCFVRFSISPADHEPATLPIMELLHNVNVHIHQPLISILLKSRQILIEQKRDTHLLNHITHYREVAPMI